MPLAGLSDISATRLRGHMSVLASDEMEGLETGTPGFDRAAAYVVDQLRALGLKPGAEDWRQSMTIRRSQADEANTSLRVQLGGSAAELSYGEDFVTYGMRGADEAIVEGDLVHAGDGVSVPGGLLDAYRGVDVRDKVVVLTAGAPSSMGDSERSFYGDERQKAVEAAARGARAIVLVDDPRIPWDLRVQTARQLGTSETHPAPAADDSPIPLFSEPVRHKATTRRVRARRHVKAGADGWRPRELASAPTARELPSSNVVAILPGRDPQIAREHIVVLAHCDHVGIGTPVDGDGIYNGAVDNASGVAAMLEIARALASAPLLRSVVFLCTTGEEQGLLGARHFVAHRASMPRAIVAAINIDGTSIQPFSSLDVRGGVNSSLGVIADDVARQTGLQLRHEGLGVGGSDHSPFLLAGIPPVWIGATLPDDWMRTRYHKPSDDMQQPIDFDAVARFTQFVAMLTRLVGDSPRSPSWRR